MECRRVGAEHQSRMRNIQSVIKSQRTKLAKWAPMGENGKTNFGICWAIFMEHTIG